MGLKGSVRSWRGVILRTPSPFVPPRERETLTGRGLMWPAFWDRSGRYDLARPTASDRLLRDSGPILRSTKRDRPSRQSPPKCLGPRPRRPTARGPRCWPRHGRRRSCRSSGAGLMSLPRGQLSRRTSRPTGLRETSGTWFRVAEVVARFQMECTCRRGPAGVCGSWGVFCGRRLWCIVSCTGRLGPPCWVRVLD